MAMRDMPGPRLSTPSRRTVCCGATAALVCCLPQIRAQAALLREHPLELVEIAEGIHVSHGVHAEVVPDNLGAIANIGVIVGGERLAVIDSGGCLLWGKRLHEAVRRISDLPIGYLIQTHMHPDHIFGAAAFLADRPEILGHRNLPAALARREAYYLRRLRQLLGDFADGSVFVPPTSLVETGAQLELGGRIIEVTAHRPAHTDNDLSVFDGQTGTLWAGDLLFMERIPALDGSIIGWLTAMEELRAVPARRVVPGHGPSSAEWPAALAPQQRYLERLRDEIRAIVHRGGTMEQAIAAVGQEEATHWLLFDDYHRRNIAAAFHELEWE
jgi:quinoprotein relay system zinc metallohydrolase 2